MTDAQLKAVAEEYAELQVAAMALGMAVDIETLSLTTKSDYKEPAWLANWKEKQHGADIDNRFDYDQV